MKNIQLSERSQLAIEKKVGISFSEIVRMDAEDIERSIEKNVIHGKLKILLNKIPYIIVRGTIYFFTGRLFHINTNRLDHIIEKI